MISSFGRIKNIKKNFILKLILVGGYYMINLSKNNIMKHFRLNRLVAKHFIFNNDPLNKKYVDHINNDKLNNRVENLQWVTQKQNIGNYYKNFKKKLDKPILQFDLENIFIKKWQNIFEILENYDYNDRMLYYCLNGKYKTAYGYKWEYKNKIIHENNLANDETFINIGTINKYDLSNYNISNYGKIKSLKNGKYLKYNKSNLYYTIMLYDKITKKGIRLTIHRLVALLFVNGKTNEKNKVNHIDEIKINNYYKNLEWCTPAYNNKYSFGKKVKQIDLKTNKLLNIFDSIGDAINYLGYSKNYSGHISECCNNPKRISALGYNWKFIDID